MSTLFLDSTYDISLGLLDQSLHWKDFRSFSGQKASTTLQKEAHRLLSDFETDPQSLESLITVAGPGFYTGLRLSEGFADVLSFFGIPHYSFYTYEIPQWCGIKQGTWLTKAYRGEYFFHQWTEHTAESRLIAASDLEEAMNGVELFYIHSLSALDDKSKALLPRHISTVDLLKQRPDVLKEVCEKKLKRESFYFRAPEDEFKVSP